MVQSATSAAAEISCYFCCTIIYLKIIIFAKYLETSLLEFPHSAVYAFYVENSDFSFDSFMNSKWHFHVSTDFFSVNFKMIRMR
jgi:hypothetical protein